MAKPNWKTDLKDSLFLEIYLSEDWYISEFISWICTTIMSLHPGNNFGTTINWQTVSPGSTIQFSSLCQP